MRGFEDFKRSNLSIFLHGFQTFFLQGGCNVAESIYFASMASVIRKAAISLSVDSLRIEMLETPATIREEAQVFAERFSSRANVIVVTDAVHMPRAMKFFEEEGITAIAAPTNYLIKKDDNPFDLKWLPSVENFLLMDRVWREFFGSVKAIIFSSYPSFSPKDSHGERGKRERNCAERRIP